MANGTTFTMSGSDRRFTREELVDRLNAEAATLDPSQWVGGWNVHDFIVEAQQTGIIGVEFEGDDHYPSEPNESDFQRGQLGGA